MDLSLPTIEIEASTSDEEFDASPNYPTDDALNYIEAMPVKTDHTVNDETAVDTTIEILKPETNVNGLTDDAAATFSPARSTAQEFQEEDISHHAIEAPGPDSDGDDQTEDEDTMRVLPGAYYDFPRGYTGERTTATPSSAGATSTTHGNGIIDAESQRVEDSTNLAVTAEAYAVNEDADDDERENPPEAKVVLTIAGIEKKRFYQMMAAFAVFTLVAVVGILVPKIQNIGVAEADARLRAEKRARKHKVLVEMLSPLAGEGVFDPDGPDSSPNRIAALDWLVDNVPENAGSTPDYPGWKVTQRYIMALLYYSTNGLEWLRQANFLSKLDECNWRDISVDNGVFYPEPENLPTGLGCDEDGGVAVISLMRNNLTGTLPHEISFLNDSLTYLGLLTNSVSSTIPSSFENLKKLNVLSLADNCLTGTIPATLSSTLKMVKVGKFHGNPDLRGSINGFCDETNIFYNPVAMLFGADCGGCHEIEVEELVECDCCSWCCDPNTYTCCSNSIPLQSSFYFSELALSGEEADQTTATIERKNLPKFC